MALDLPLGNHVRFDDGTRQVDAEVIDHIHGDAPHYILSALDTQEWIEATEDQVTDIHPA